MIEKQLASRLLLPLAALFERIDGRLSRLWNFSRLRCQLGRDLDPSIVVLGLPEIRGSRNIRLGKDLFLYRELYWETQGAGRIEIGDRVVMSRGTHIVAFESISIGSGSMIGEYVSIRDANHKFGTEVALRDSGHESSPIRIGEQVWIGRGVMILPGVTIGDGAVIGANAVVSRDIPAGTIAVGIPAKPIVKEIARAS